MKLAILANGPSLADHDLSRIACDVMGMNRSWKLFSDPDHHVALDGDHYRDNPFYHESLAERSRLYVAGGAWKIGRKMPLLPGPGFSKDIREGVVAEMGGVGSVTFVALQVAYSLGYRQCFILGLDLQGSHFDGTPAGSQMGKQNAMFALVPEEMKVWTCGSPESLATFPKVDFGSVCS